jgi:putative MATE family efflux protein
MNELKEMEYGKITSQLFKFSLPAIGIMVINALYNTVDKVFIGHAEGDAGIAAVTAAFPATMVAMSIGILISVGAATLLNLAMGRKETDRAESILTHSFAAAALFSLVMTAIGLWTTEGLLLLFGASADVLKMGIPYLRIILAGMPFQIIAMSVGISLRAQGKPAQDLLLIFTASILNIILDPIFIFSFNMGISGAALATVISQAVALLLTLVFVQASSSKVKIRFSGFCFKTDIFSGILLHGLPIGMIQIISSLMFIAANFSIRRYGDGMALAVIGIINTLSMFFLYPVAGFAQGAQTLIGFNHGAGKRERVREIVWRTMLIVVSIGAFSATIVGLFPERLVRLFGEMSSEVIRLTGRGLRFTMVAFIIAPIHMVATQYFQATGKPGRTSLILVIRSFLFIILIIGLPIFLGINGVFLAIPLSEVLTSLVVLVMLPRSLRDSGNQFVDADRASQLNNSEA